MRLAFAFALLVCVPWVAWSQTIAPLERSGNDQETLFPQDVRHGGYGGIVYGATMANGEATYLRGTRGAWVINLTDRHAVNLGLAGYRTATAFEATDWGSDGPPPTLTSRYRGFEIEYVNRSQQLFHFSAQLLVGSGDVQYDDDPGIDADIERTRDEYFVLQPGANVNLNVTRWFRLTGGVLYRYAGGVNLAGTSDSDLSGLASYVTLRFGRF